MKKQIPLPERQRTVPRNFSWLDHRLIREGYLKHLNNESSVLYLFLLTVADRDGLSWYSDRRICELTPLREVASCRNILIDADLIAFEDGVYQVLSLPAIPRVKIGSKIQKLHISPKPAQELKAHRESTAEEKDSFPPELYELLRKLS